LRETRDPPSNLEFHAQPRTANDLRLPILRCTRYISCWCLSRYTLHATCKVDIIRYTWIIAALTGGSRDSTLNA
jgi:hypothetical protein